MASNSKNTGDKKKTEKTLTKEEIYNGFQQLRQEQRNLVTKLSQMEMDLNEHKIVIDTLKLVNEDRKCFRMIGGVLCERTVKDVLPTLETNKEQLQKVIEAFNDQVTKKGVEINEYKEKYNIKLQGHQDPEVQSAEKSETNTNEKDSKTTRGNVLVADS